MLKYNKIIIMIVTAMIPAIVFAEWQSLEAPPAGRADDLSIGKHGGTYYLYAADNTHFLYRSTNLGAEWDSIEADYTDNPTCVLTEEDDGWTVYIGRHVDDPEQRVMKSTDGGDDWDPAGGTFPNWISNPNPLCFAMDPNDADIVYLGCKGGGADNVFKTTDGGDHWYTKSIPASPKPNSNDFAITTDPRRGTWIYAACSGVEDEQGIWLSTNGGNNWSQELIDIPTFAIAFAGQEIGYAGSDNGVYKSTNSGDSWSLLNNSPECKIYDLEVITSTIVYAATTDGIYLTEDGGDSWDPKNQGIHGTVLRKSLYTITTHPDDTQKLFTGGEYALYKTTNSGDNWVEKTKGMRLAEYIILNISLPYIYSTERRITYPENVITIRRSTDYGNTWSSMSAGRTGQVLSGQHEHRDIIVDYNDPDYVYYGYFNSNYAQSPNGTIIIVSDDGCATELYVHVEGASEMIYAMAGDPENTNRVYVSFVEKYGDFDRVIKTTDYGETFFFSGTGLPEKVTDIIVDPKATNNLYVGTCSGNKGVWKSTNAGGGWSQIGLNNIIVYALAVDCDYDIIYAGCDESNGIYKSTNSGNTWTQMNSGLDYKYIRDIEIDPAEPTLIYTVCRQNQETSQHYVYCSVDRGGKWFNLSEGLTAEWFRTLRIDTHPGQPKTVYLGTEKGIYTYTPDFNKSLVSSSDKATSYNNGRKMIRDVNYFWITYESGGVIYVVRSTDGGESWSKKTELGKGHNPCISIKKGFGPTGPTLGIVWWAESLRDTMYFSKYSSGTWGTPFAIVSSNNNFGPPSLDLGNDNYGYLVYVEGGSDIKYTKFDINNQSVPVPENVGTGVDPSIGFMTPGSGYPEIHVAWQNGTRLYYRSKKFSTGWNDREYILANGLHPFLEVVGSAVHVVCEKSDDIWHCYTVYTGVGHQWSNEQINNSNDASTSPVITGGSACAWVEENDLTANKEIFYSWDSPLGWSAPINISSTSECSDYPHIVHKQTLLGTTIYFTWTENDNVPYDIEFTNTDMGDGGRGEELILPFYMAHCGEKESSPFNLRRAGYIQYGLEFYEKIDYDPEHLEYQFIKLNPENEYALAAYTYYQGQDNLLINIKVDDKEIGKITLPPDSLIVLTKLLPSSLYADGMINVKLFSEKAVSAELVVYEYEKESGTGGGGPQNAGTDPLIPQKTMLSVFPNPVHKEISIQYSLSRRTDVELSLFDVTGRVVMNMVGENQSPGTYSKSFEINNFSQGVYFVRLVTADKSIVKKVIFLK